MLMNYLFFLYASLINPGITWLSSLEKLSLGPYKFVGIKLIILCPYCEEMDLPDLN